MASIPQRQIAFSVELAQNTQTNQPSTFAESGTNLINVQGLRVSARIRNAGKPTTTATLKVWGLTPSVMNQLSSLGLITNLVPKNQVTIRAGDDQIGLSTVFQGTITQAYGEYENQPDVSFTMEAAMNLAGNAIKVAPTSFPQSFDVAQAMSGFARQMGLSFQNYGVTTKLPPMYFSGAPMVQARKCAEAAQIEMGVNGTTLEITPRNVPKQSGQVITISPANGMISYPAFTSQGIMVKTLFNPQITFKSMIKVNSSLLSSITNLKNAIGGNFPSQWMVLKVDLDLDANLPKGQWMMTLYCYNPGKATTIVPPP